MLQTALPEIVNIKNILKNIRHSLLFKTQSDKKQTKI